MPKVLNPLKMRSNNSNSSSSSSNSIQPPTMVFSTSLPAKLHKCHSRHMQQSRLVATLPSHPLPLLMHRHLTLRHPHHKLLFLLECLLIRCSMLPTQHNPMPTYSNQAVEYLSNSSNTQDSRLMRQVMQVSRNRVQPTHNVLTKCTKNNNFSCKYMHTIIVTVHVT